jgi:hypothetical protein
MNEPGRPVPSFAVFRLLFATGNAVVWFVILWVIATVVGPRSATGVIGFTAGVVCAATAGFFVPFFGIPGGLAGFLEQGVERRFVLPPAERWGAGGRLGAAWRTALGRATVSSPVLAALAAAGLAAVGDLPRSTFCLALAAAGATLAAAHAYVLANPRTLGDLRRASPALGAPLAGYFLWRFLVPQGAGNGVLNGLIGLSIFGTAGHVLKPAGEVAIDFAATAAILAFFMVTTAGSLARADARLGYVGRLTGTRPSRARRAALVVATGVGAGVATAGVMRVAGLDGLGLWAFVVWKTAIAAVVAGVLAARAARWALTGPA